METTSRSAVTTDALERSLRSFSINDSVGAGRCYGGGGTREARKPEAISQQDHDITLDLNSETSLPYNWEQCLDLKTGDIYFINKSNGTKTKEDPREMVQYSCEYYYSEDDEDDDDKSCDYETDEDGCSSSPVEREEENVLVAAGCRSCLMYYMVPKQVNHCPKCKHHLLHFDRPENSASAYV